MDPAGITLLLRQIVANSTAISLLDYRDDLADP